MRLEIDEYDHVVHHRYLAKKRKDHESRVGLRALLLIHEGKTLEQVGQILEVARSTVQRWIEKYRRNGDEACAEIMWRICAGFVQCCKSDSKTPGAVCIEKEL